MKVRPLPTVTGDRARQALIEAANSFANIRGRSAQSGNDLYNAYMRTASEQFRVLASVLPAADLDRLVTTPRYWMLHSIDPAGKAPVLPALMSVELDEKINVLEEAARSVAGEMSRYSHTDLIVVPDTNVLIHHPQSIANIPWEKLASKQAKRVIVAIPVLVVDELDKAKRRTDKIENGKESVRTRAQRTIATLEDWFQTQTSYELPRTRPVIEMVLVIDDPDRPRLLDPDYEIIDTAHTLFSLSGTATVIASADLGMRLRARASGLEARDPQDLTGEPN